MLRVVLDTNVIISGTIHRKGNAFRIMEAWRRRRFLLIVSDALAEEVKRVLTYAKFQKYDLTPHKGQRLIHLLKSYGVSTEGKLQVSVISEDPPDNQVLSAAIEGAADYIVTGDKHVQSIGSYQSIPIVSPREFLKVLEKKAVQ